MKKIVLFVVSLLLVNVNLFSQDDWQPRTNVTGYLNTVFEYSMHQDVSATGVDNEKHVGIGLAEAGLLVSYLPFENVELKVTTVYSPWVNSFQEYFIEMYGAYKINDNIRLAAGKFLTPLSPGNLYFYAPLNHSGSLPMVISHHFLFPQSISGLQVKGNYGDKFKIGFNLTYGSWQALAHQSNGILGILGQEELPPYLGVRKGDIEEVAYPPKTFLGGTGRLSFDYDGIVSLGFNTFEGTKSQTPILALDGSVDFFAKGARRTYGADFHLKVVGLEFNAEYWLGSENPEADSLTKLEYTGYYVEAIYSLGNFKPWVRYEYIEDAKGQFGYAHPMGAFDVGQQVEVGMNKLSFGVAYRPTFSTTFKVEYHMNMIEKHVDKESPFFPVLSKMEDYNYVQCAFVYSF